MDGSDGTTVSDSYDYYEEEVLECDGWYELELFWFLGPTIALTVLLGLFKKRKKIRLDFLGGRPGTIYPVNFIDEHDKRWAYAAGFGILSYETMDIFSGDMWWQPYVSKDLKFVKVFVVAINVLILAITFYPLFVCITLRRYWPLNILGFLISGCYMAIAMISFSICDPTSPKDDRAGMIQQVVLAPVYLCYVVLLVSFLYDFICNIRMMCRKQIEPENTTARKSRNIKYMEALMERRIPPEEMTLKQRLVERVRYQKIAGLRLSLRVICTMSVAIFILYKAAVIFGHVFDIYCIMIIDLVKETELDSTVDALKELFGLAIPGLKFLLDIPIMDVLLSFRYSLILANVITVVLQVTFIIHIAFTYRSNMRSLLQGDHSFHANIDASPTGRLMGCIRYSGYQIAYMIYGFFICYALLTIILFLISVLIFVPIVRRMMTWILWKIVHIWPTVLISFGVYLLQFFMVKFFFLQERGAYLALNNRRFYHAICFVLFFFNIMLGLFACLKRVVFSLVLGTFLLPRLDHCLLMRGFERFDSGYLAYIATLVVDEYHTHPLLKAAIEILQQRVEETSYRASSHQSNIDLTGMEMKKTSDQLRRKYIRNRWWKMVTLINNPAIVLDKAQQEVREQMRKGEKVATLPMLGLTVDNNLDNAEKTHL